MYLPIWHIDNFSVNSRFAYIFIAGFTYFLVLSYTGSDPIALNEYGLKAAKTVLDTHPEYQGLW